MKTFETIIRPFVRKTGERGHEICQVTPSRRYGRWIDPVWFAFAADGADTFERATAHAAKSGWNVNEAAR